MHSSSSSSSLAPRSPRGSTLGMARGGGGGGGGGSGGMGSAGLQHPHSSDLSLSSLAGHRPSIASGDSVQLKEANDVVCVGLACVDVTSRPVVDTAEQTARLHLIEEVNFAVAGPCFGTAVALAKLGISVGVQAAVGRDGMGFFMVHDMKGYNVDTQHVRWKRGVRTSCTLFFIDSDPDKERPCMHAPGANDEFGLEDVNLRQIEKARILYVGGVGFLKKLDGEPTVRLLKHAKGVNVTTVLNVMSPLTDIAHLVDPCMPYTDYLMCHIDTARKCANKPEGGPEEVAAYFLERGAGCCVFTMGADGSALVDKSGTVIVIPAYPVDQCVDVSGCGISHGAGFIYGIHQGLPREQSMRIGAAAAALTMRVLGSDLGFDNLGDVEAFMHAHE